MVQIKIKSNLILIGPTQTTEIKGHSPRLSIALHMVFN